MDNDDLLNQILGTTTQAAEEATETAKKSSSFEQIKMSSDNHVLSKEEYDTLCDESRVALNLLENFAKVNITQQAVAAQGGEFTKLLPIYLTAEQFAEVMTSMGGRNVPLMLNILNQITVREMTMKMLRVDTEE